MPECVPCPAADPCAPSAGIKSGLRDGNLIDGKEQFPCPCHSCCCGKPPPVKPCYKQPKIPESYAPRRCYMRPTAKVESSTTYGMSFLPVDGCKNLRGVARKPAPNLVPSCDPMEGCTVQKLSFLPNPVCVTQPIRPCHHDMWGQGPMQNLTTQRHDYVPKPCVLRESCKPAPKFHSVEQPFENRTINKLSYLPPTKLEPTKSFAPERCYEKPAAKMDGSTTHKMSYMPNAIQPKQAIPWACKGQYQKPCQRLDANTTYTMSFLDAGSDCRRRAIIPPNCVNPVTPSKRFETATVYKNSYLPTVAPIPQPIKPLPNLVPSTAQMEGDTVQKLSFLPNPVCVTQPIRPCHHDMWGQGPMQNLTTQRHDYVPKPVSIRESCKPPSKFHCLEQPFENRTINRMSYLNPGRIPPPVSFAPMKCYEKPAAKMESSTTQKMSYQPVCAPAPQRPPWACKGQYQKPCQRFCVGKCIEDLTNAAKGTACGVERLHAQLAKELGCLAQQNKNKSSKSLGSISGTGGGPPGPDLTDLDNKILEIVGPASVYGFATVDQLDATTVYGASFLPPGEDCSEYMNPCSYGDCKPCDCICPATCIATDPCACDFPRAECCG